MEQGGNGTVSGQEIDENPVFPPLSEKAKQTRFPMPAGGA
jgi:hypothetical protein